MSHITNRLFFGIFIAMALAAAALILSIPPLFSLHEQYRLWLTLVLGGLTVALGVAVVLMRPSNRNRHVEK